MPIFRRRSCPPRSALRWSIASRIRNAAATARSGVGKVAITASPIVLTTAPASDVTTSCKTRKCARTRSKATRSPTRSVLHNEAHWWRGIKLTGHVRATARTWRSRAGSTDDPRPHQGVRWRSFNPKMAGVHGFRQRQAPKPKHGRRRRYLHWAFGDPRPNELDPIVLLWWMRRRVCLDRLTKRRVLQFEFQGLPRTYWLLLQPAEVSAPIPENLDHLLKVATGGSEPVFHPPSRFC